MAVVQKTGMRRACQSLQVVDAPRASQASTQHACTRTARVAVSAATHRYEDLQLGILYAQKKPRKERRRGGHERRNRGTSTRTLLRLARRRMLPTLTRRRAAAALTVR